MEKPSITVISGTNRPDSNSEIVGALYVDLLKEIGVESQLLKLIDLPESFVFSDMYNRRSPEMTQIIELFIEPVDKFVFVIPEYNGGFPGVLKAFVDCVPPRLFHNKKAGLVGLSSGRAGSLRSMDQFTNVLNYLKVHVHFNKPKLSGIEQLISTDRKLHDEFTLKILREHAGAMVDF